MQIIDSSTFKLPGFVRKVLLIQLGDIGDVVWTTPSIRAVKNSVPNAKVFVLVKEGFGGLLEADPSIEQVFEVKSYRGNLFQQAAGHLSFLRELRAKRFDLVVDLRLGDRGAFMAFATGAPMRVTLHHPGGVPFWRNYLFTHGAVPWSAVYTRGAVAQSLGILKVLGIDTDDHIPRLWIADTIKRRIREILVREKVEGCTQWITINPFSRWSYKEWNSDKWIEIINWLSKDFAIPVIVIGSAEEQPKAEALIRRCETGIFNFAGKTTLAELTGLLGQSLLHIGVDSAAPHIAAAVGTPTMTIYGPSSWKEWAPVGKDHCVIASDMDCVPCFKKGCDNSGHSRCLETLTVDQVKNAIRETVENQMITLSTK
ncbi:MAG TPA: glycosyltransferase family 9 protein [Smithella sp.]|nr:glycosyltransferase family 9 protein [Smithella sp.]HPN87276.1 glycosyltransferase family 9 protein [Smithella sp.]